MRNTSGNFAAGFNVCVWLFLSGKFAGQNHMPEAAGAFTMIALTVMILVFGDE